MSLVPPEKLVNIETFKAVPWSDLSAFFVGHWCQK
jgi:hypothetical protein